MKSLLSIAAIAILVLSCSGPKKTQGTEKWSVRMANSVMQRADTLTHYLGARESKGWQYDVAMLAQAIDKLGNIDPKILQIHDRLCERVH
ncbi:MAG: hypothetical protein QM786_08110 [Breznakibacter sp.]